MNSFADRLRFARNLRGLTQAQLAKACGVSQGAIANYEGKSRRSAKEIFKLASVLKVHAQWLAEGVGSMELNPPSVPQQLTNYRLTDPQSANTVSSWPFKDISPDTYWAITDEGRVLIERAVAAMVTSLSTKHPGG